MNTTLYSFATGGTTDLEADISTLSIRVVMISSLILVVLLALAVTIVKNKKLHIYKKPLFASIIIAILIPSLLMMGSTVYINTISESKGPVHWHTDIEFWVCGEEIELRNPTGFLSNKIGTSTYHEHDDKRIHLEGVVVEKDYDASLEKLMDVIGGSITDTNLVIPTENIVFENDIDGDASSGNTLFAANHVTSNGEGYSSIAVENGESCNDSDIAEIQAFLYSYDKESMAYEQTKLDNPKEYIMRDESMVPPGDCLIVEFDAIKNRTDKLCMQYGVRDSVRCMEFGVSEYNPDLCNSSEVFTTQYNDAEYEEITPVENEENNNVEENTDMPVEIEENMLGGREL